MNSVPLEKAGVGSAMNDTTRQLGGALGVATLGTLATNVYLSGVEPLRESLVGLPAQAAEAIASSIQAAHVVASDVNLPAAVRQTILATADQAFVSGMNTAMLIASGLMLGGFVLVLVLLPSTAAARAAGIPEGAAAEAAGD